MQNILNNYVLIQEIITDAPKSSISIGTAMVDNADIDENGEYTDEIYEIYEKEK